MARSGASQPRKIGSLGLEAIQQRSIHLLVHVIFPPRMDIGKGIRKAIASGYPLNRGKVHILGVRTRPGLKNWRGTIQMARGKMHLESSRNLPKWVPQVSFLWKIGSGKKRA